MLDDRVRSLPERPVVGVLHPGAMGAAIGSALKAAASAVIWADKGRSHATAKRAELADLIAVPDVPELTRRADVVVSICPPHAALDVAREVAAAAAGDPPLYVEANAVAPQTVQAVAELFGPENVVDGAVIGPPGWTRGTTTLWLAGRCAPAVAELFAGSPFEARVLGAELGAASALKACYALQSKAIPAAWLALFATARAYGVEEALRSELDRKGSEREMTTMARRAGDRAWRWAGEMDEAAAAFAAAGLPNGFSTAAAEVYRRIAAADADELGSVWGMEG
ncbi:3-hydroxyisobutyrate dehydrogenase [Pseudonocardia thermophila]|uniref:3-hydroxyisobutyrate dehydrogenase n=1 Tax=Pseudonocardia thermophila TaxID=1848 RepID=A0A1M6NMT7_PSETH|nr:3-hydroxyisobutyrate dehydrogenase [Pseudonocardia thermophila]